MAQPLLVPLPAQHSLDDTYTLRITAVSPTTGAVVAGVKVGAVTMIVDNLSGGNLASGSFQLFQLVPGPGA